MKVWKFENRIFKKSQNAKRQKRSNKKLSRLNLHKKSNEDARKSQEFLRNSITHEFSHTFMRTKNLLPTYSSVNLSFEIIQDKNPNKTLNKDRFQISDFSFESLSSSK
jgi:hypothetical protein